MFSKNTLENLRKLRHTLSNVTLDDISRYAYNLLVQRSDVVAKRFLGKLVFVAMTNSVKYKLSKEFLSAVLTVVIYNSVGRADRVVLQRIIYTFEDRISEITDNITYSLEIVIGKTIFDVLKSPMANIKASQAFSKITSFLQLYFYKAINNNMLIKLQNN